MSFIHQSSFVDDDVKIGEGTKVWHFSHILSRSIIGENCKELKPQSPYANVKLLEEKYLKKTTKTR